MANDKDGNYIDLNTTTKTIRKAIRKLSKEHGVKPLSVRRDRGTAAGWVNISGSLEFGKFTDKEEQVLKDFGLVYAHGGIKNVISTDEHDSVYHRALEILEDKPPKEVRETLPQTLEDNPRAERVLKDFAAAQSIIYRLRINVSYWYTGNPENPNDKAVKNIIHNLDNILDYLESDKYFDDLKKLD